MNDKELKERPKAEANSGAKDKAKEKAKPKLRRRWVRLLIGLVKLLLVPVLCVAALGFGLWLGYVYVGGSDSADVWEWSTWKHLFDLVFSS